MEEYALFSIFLLCVSPGRNVIFFVSCRLPFPSLSGIKPFGRDRTQWGHSQKKEDQPKRGQNLPCSLFSVDSPAQSLQHWESHGKDFALWLREGEGRNGKELFQKGLKKGRKWRFWLLEDVKILQSGGKRREFYLSNNWDQKVQCFYDWIIKLTLKLLNYIEIYRIIQMWYF